MSAGICVETEMTDKRFIVQAIKRAVKDIFPQFHGEVQTADKPNLRLYTGDMGEIRISANDVRASGRVVLVTKTGQRICYPSRAAAEAEAKKLRLQVDKIIDAPPSIHGDIGYMKGKDGNYVKVMDDMDIRANNWNPSGGLLGEEFDKRVKTYYDGMKLYNHAVSKGIKATNPQMQSSGKAKAEIEVEISEELIALLAERRGLRYQVQ